VAPSTVGVEPRGERRGRRLPGADRAAVQPARHEREQHRQTRGDGIERCELSPELGEAGRVDVDVFGIVTWQLRLDRRDDPVAEGDGEPRELASLEGGFGLPPEVPRQFRLVCRERPPDRVDDRRPEGRPDVGVHPTLEAGRVGC
jgi:hypothetical protein